MNTGEAGQLLALIKLAYPMAYRDIDDETAIATVNMWQKSFPEVPYPIMEQAFNHFRMVSKFPPTVAEMVGELRSIYFQATECALVHKALDNEEAVRQYRAIMQYTERYKDDSRLGGLNINTLPRLGGVEYEGLPGSPGDNLD